MPKNLEFKTNPELNLTTRKHVIAQTSFLRIMTFRKGNNPELLPTSPGDDDSDTPAPEIKPVPGLNGAPVRCM